MINKIESLKLLKQNFLDFFLSENWINYFMSSESNGPSFFGIITTFSDYAQTLFKENNTLKLKLIFEFTERMLQEGDQEVRNAFTTCFLENLLNIIPDTILAKDFVPLLGQESRKYCKAWDEFTGIKTEGLHD